MVLIGGWNYIIVMDKINKNKLSGQSQITETARRTAANCVSLSLALKFAILTRQGKMGAGDKLSHVIMHYD